MTQEFTYIHVYTRREAIADGVLVDVTDAATEAGFRCPFAVTAALHARYVAVPAGVSGQDEAGRLWDLLTVLRHTILRNPLSQDELRYRLYVVTRPGTDPELVEVKAVCGPDEDGRLCVTLMLPDED